MKRGIVAIITCLVLIPLEAQDDPFLAARAAMFRGAYGEAARSLEEALEREPDQTLMMYHLGICYFRQQDYPRAKEVFYGVEKRRKGMGSFYLAKTEVRLNHPELALKYLENHLSSRFKLPEDEILLDPDLSRLENTQGWQRLWNQRDWYTTQDKEFQEALFLKNHGKELEAINLLNNLEKQGYRKSDVLAEKAEIYRSLGNERAAISAYRDAARADVRNTDARYAMASYLLEQGEAEEARGILDQILRREPDRFGAYLLRASARSKLGDLTAALEDMETYLAYFPEDHKAYHTRGMIQHRHGKYLDAIRSFNRALDMDQGNAAYFFSRGKTYAATGTIRSAERDMSMALDLDPLNGEIWFEKASLSEQLGNMDDACFAYRKAFRYGVHEAGERLEKRCR